MRLEFITAVGPQRDELVKRYQARFYETVPYIILGQYMAPIAYRKNVSVSSIRHAWSCGTSKRNSPGGVVIEPRRLVRTISASMSI